MSAVLADPSGYGRILRKSETQVGAIVEDSQLTPEQRELNEINSSIYCFTLAKLWPALAKVKPNNKHREIYLTDAIAYLASSGETVLAQIAPDSREVLGCNTRADLADVDRIFLWQGNVRILLTIVKLIEDVLNVETDTRAAGVRCIIVVEDSVRRYSSFLGLLYSELMAQVGGAALPTPQAAPKAGDEFPLQLITGARYQPYYASSFRQFEQVETSVPKSLRYEVPSLREQPMVQASAIGRPVCFPIRSADGLEPLIVPEELPGFD